MPLMLFLAALAVVAFVVAYRITPPTALVQHKVDGVRTKIPSIAWLLAIMALAFGLSEGTATDWSALHVTEVAQVDSTTGSLGLVAVSGFMVVIRLLGDRLVARFGRRAVVRFGGICAALGYGTVTVVSGLPLLLVGWALVGLGVGMIAPQVYAVAGHIGGGRVLAVVVTFGYAAFLLPARQRSASSSTISDCTMRWRYRQFFAPASLASRPPCRRATPTCQLPTESDSSVLTDVQRHRVSRRCRTQAIPKATPDRHPVWSSPSSDLVAGLSSPDRVCDEGESTAVW